MSDNILKLKLIGFVKGSSFFLPILTLYLLRYDISLSAIVMTQTFYALAVFFGEVPTGIFADTFGQKISIICGYILNVLGASLLIFFPSTEGIYLSFALIGLADSFLSGSEEALFYESYQRQDELQGSYKKHYSIFFSNAMIGVVASTLLAGIIVQFFGVASYVPLIFLHMLTMFVGFLIACSLIDIKGDIRNEAQGANAFHILKESMSLIKNNKVLFALVSVIVLTLTGEYFLYNVYQPYFQTHNVPPVFLGLVISVGAALNFLFVRYAYLLERYFSFGIIMLLINALIGVFYLSMALLVHPVLLILSVTALRGLFGVDNPLISHYANEHIPSHIRTTVLSGMSQVKFLFSIGTRTALALLVGFVGIQSTLIIQGVYLLIGALISWWLLERVVGSVKTETAP